MKYHMILAVLYSMKFYYLKITFLIECILYETLQKNALKLAETRFVGNQNVSLIILHSFQKRGCG